MARLALLAPFLALAACGLQKGGTLEETPDTGAPDVVTKDVVVDVTPDVAPCDSKQCPSDQYCVQGACAHLASCADILAADPTATSRPYAIKTPKMASPETVYCAMSIAEAPGGWTLFARTDVAGVAPFGWSSAQTDLNKANSAYAFDLKKDLKFTKGLIAVRSGALELDPAGPLLTFDFPQPFPGALGGSTIPTPNVKVARKDANCVGTSAPTALTLMGNTDSTDGYFFAEQANDAGFGITPKGFSSKILGCAADQNLNGRQILMFVR